MLKRIAEQTEISVTSTERSLSALMRFLLNESVYAVSAGSISSFVPSRRWIYLCDTSGRECCFALDGKLEVPSDEVFKEVLSFVERRLEMLPKDVSCLELLRKPAKIFDCEGKYQLLIPEKHCECAGEIFYAETEAGVLGDLKCLSEEFSHELFLAKKLYASLGLRLSRFLCESLQTGDSMSVLPELSLAVPGGQSYRCRIEGETASDPLFLEVLENMNSGEDMESQIYAELNLGQIELSMGDILKLRPGSTISFEKPKVISAALQFGDAAWALVDVRIGNDSIELSVREILPEAEKQVA